MCLQIKVSENLKKVQAMEHENKKKIEVDDHPKQNVCVVSEESLLVTQNVGTQTEPIENEKSLPEKKISKGKLMDGVVQLEVPENEKTRLPTAEIERTKHGFDFNLETGKQDFEISSDVATEGSRTDSILNWLFECERQPPKKEFSNGMNESRDTECDINQCDVSELSYQSEKPKKQKEAPFGKRRPAYRLNRRRHEKTRAPNKSLFDLIVEVILSFLSLVSLSTGRRHV